MPIMRRGLVNNQTTGTDTNTSSHKHGSDNNTMNSRHFEQILSILVIAMILLQGGNIWVALLAYLAINLVIVIREWLPTLDTHIKKWLTDIQKNQTISVSRSHGNKELYNDRGAVDLVENHDSGDIRAIIRFERNRESGASDTVIQAMMHYMSSQSTCQDVVYNQQYYVINKNEFQLQPGYFCKVTDYEHNDKGEIERYCFEVYSYRYDIHELHKFVKKVTDEYKMEQANQLGKHIYFFDEQHVDVPIGPDGQPRLDRAPKYLKFSKAQFNTNKSLNNLYGSHLEGAKKQVWRFIKDPQWYERKGRPYTMGILLHGPPGSGKTSFIKAIAKVTGRYIFNLKLRSTTTQTQLTRLFFEEDVHIMENGSESTVKIPLDKRIYVIEDIDSLTDVVLDRRIQQERMLDRIRKRNGHNAAITQTKSGPANASNGSTPIGAAIDPVGVGSGMSSDEQLALERMMGEEQDRHPDALNLSFLLNLLDGILETPGRVLIATTNHPEQLDPALIRPGRIDLDIEVGYCNTEMVTEMLSGFFEHPVKLPSEFINNYQDTITPAVMYAILQNADSVDATDQAVVEKEAIEDLVRIMRAHNKQHADMLAAQAAADAQAAEWMKKQESSMAAWSNMMMNMNSNANPNANPNANANIHNNPNIPNDNQQDILNSYNEFNSAVFSNAQHAHATTHATTPTHAPTQDNEESYTVSDNHYEGYGEESEEELDDEQGDYQGDNVGGDMSDMMRAALIDDSDEGEDDDNDNDNVKDARYTEVPAVVGNTVLVNNNVLFD